MRRLLLALASLPTFAVAQVSASFDPATGTYAVRDAASGWRLAGTVEGARNVGRAQGRDKLGSYQATSFEWNAAGTPVRGTIRTYGDRRIALFDLRYLGPKAGRAVVFPRFTSVPAGLSSFSYRDTVFAPGESGLAETGTPWLRFDVKSRAMVLSPASDFLTAKMRGGEDDMGVGMNDDLTGVAKGADPSALLAFGNGIGRTWDAWGSALRSLFDRKTPANDADVVLRSYGYWTDNGADYYYRYDRDKGYAGTMLALADHYRSEGLPLGYLQLDSWWYDKTETDPEGREGHARNPDLPKGPWNRYGGTTTYRADKTLFPDGLAAFQKRLGLPLVVHGRWIDPRSPYHENYKISGLAPVDPRWWNDTAAYLASSGVATYEQDWLDPIYKNSPRLIDTIGVGDAFSDGMAGSTRAKGLGVQYCMAPPKFFLQGVRYPNLTTIRTSGDRFEPGKWGRFLTTSELAWQIGAWPWADVFMSRETGNLTLALLSGGPVGTGDAIGKEDAANIRRAARPDGVLVKADQPATPCDLVYQNAAAGRKAPFLAATTAGLSTLLFEFLPKEAAGTLDLRPEDVGVTVDSYLYDTGTGEGRRWAPGETASLGAEGQYAYWIVAPFTRTGVALLGDLGKIVPTGRARIASTEDGADGLRVGVAFAKGEGPVTLTVVAPRSPKVRANRGTARLTAFDPATGRATVEVSPQGERAYVTIDGRA